VTAARQSAPCLALRRPEPALSTHERGVATLAVPPLRFAAPHFLALRSGFFRLRARSLSRAPTPPVGSLQGPRTCYLGSRSDLSPRVPVYFVTQAPGLYPLAPALQSARLASRASQWTESTPRRALRKQANLFNRLLLLATPIASVLTRSGRERLLKFNLGLSAA
jgi:hypothetical protein